MLVDRRCLGLVVGPDGTPYRSMGDEESLKVNEHGSLRVVGALPSLAEIVKYGESYQVKTATPRAAIANAQPTTTAGLSLWNGENADGRCYVIERIGVLEVVVDTTQQNQLALFALNSLTPIAAPTDAALSIRSLTGRSGYAGKARTVDGATVVDQGWFPHANSVAGAAAVAGGLFRVTEANVAGLYIVRPGGMFSVQASKLAATASQCVFFITWHEVVLNAKG